MTSRELRLDSSLAAFDWSIVVIVLAALVTAGVYRHRLIAPERSVRAFGGQVRLDLPEGWVADHQNDTFTVQRPAIGEFTPSMSITRVSIPDGEDTGTFMDLHLATMQRERARSGVAYRVLSAEDRVAFGGHPCAWTRFAFVKDPPGTAIGDAVLPVVLEGWDVLVTTKDGRAFHVAALAPAGEIEQLTSVLDSLKISK